MGQFRGRSGHEPRADLRHALRRTAGLTGQQESLPVGAGGQVSTVVQESGALMVIVYESAQRVIRIA